MSVMLSRVDAPEDALQIGDILRLPENCDLGPGSLPVDLLVFDPNDDECGLGLVTLSGYKAGLVYALLPLDSLVPGARLIDPGWLSANWDRWFCYEHEGRMRVMDRSRARVIAWNKRLITENA